jgi:hypothetical protein
VSHKKEFVLIFNWLELTTDFSDNRIFINWVTIMPGFCFLKCAFLHLTMKINGYTNNVAMYSCIILKISFTFAFICNEVTIIIPQACLWNDDILVTRVLLCSIL